MDELDCLRQRVLDVNNLRKSKTNLKGSKPNPHLNSSNSVENVSEKLLLSQNPSDPPQRDSPPEISPTPPAHTSSSPGTCPGTTLCSSPSSQADELKSKHLKRATNSVRTAVISNKENVQSKQKDDTKNREKKARRTLIDDQREVNKKFSDKIVEHSSGFTCKSCTFATGIRLIAKTHAVNCGKKKKKPVKKVVYCEDCDETFKKKAQLYKHFQRVHQLDKHKCSKCSKSYKLRKSFMLHLKSHDSEFLDRFKCTKCSYKTRDNWLLQRHTKLKHTDKVRDIVAQIIEEIIQTGTIAEVVVVTQAQETDDIQCNDADIVIRSYSKCSVSIVQGFINHEALELYESVDTDINLAEVRRNRPEKDEVLLLFDEFCDYVNESIDEDEFSDTNEVRDDKLCDDELSDDEISDDELSDDETNGDELSDETCDTAVNPMIGLSTEPCHYEKIRNDIIKERETMIAESCILDEINEAKRDLIKHNKSCKTRPKTRRKKSEIPCNSIKRRSDRIKDKDTDITKNNILHDVKIEIKVELQNASEGENELIEVDTAVINASHSDVIPRNLIENDNNVVNGAVMSVDVSDTSQVDREKGETRGKKYSCDQCGYQTIDNYHLKRHSEMHSPSQIQCLKCDTICDTKYHYTEHSRTCYYSCPYDGCSKKFKGQARLEGHKRDHVKSIRRLVKNTLSGLKSK